MRTPAYRHSPNDPERTDLIPRAGGFGGRQAPRPGAPRPGAPPPGARPPGAPGGYPMPPGGFRPEPEPVDVEPIVQEGRRRRLGRKRPLWKELLTLAAVALLMTFLIQHFLGRAYSIPSGSMEKTLHGCTNCDSDRILVDKLTYAFTDPEPGDVVVFEGPDTWAEEYEEPPSGNFITTSLQQVGSLVGLAPPNERDFVKRVIAVGGQTVECCDEKMRVLVEGKPLDEPYIYWNDGKPDDQQRFDPVVVPQGTLWVMGDNRNNSKDSRTQGGGGLRGIVPVDNVIGKARSVVLPVSRWQGIGDHNPQGDTPVALGAPSWQGSMPVGLGVIAALPVLWLGRRIGSWIRPASKS